MSSFLLLALVVLYLASLYVRYRTHNPKNIEDPDYYKKEKSVGYHRFELLSSLALRFLALCLLHSLLFAEQSEILIDGKIISDGAYSLVLVAFAFTFFIYPIFRVGYDITTYKIRIKPPLNFLGEGQKSSKWVGFRDNVLDRISIIPMGLLNIFSITVIYYARNSSPVLESLSSGDISAYLSDLHLYYALVHAWVYYAIFKGVVPFDYGSSKLKKQDEFTYRYCPNCYQNLRSKEFNENYDDPVNVRTDLAPEHAITNYHLCGSHNIRTQAKLE